MSLILCKINKSFDQTGVDVADIFSKLGDLTIDHCDDLVHLTSVQALEILRLYACPELKTLSGEICELPGLKYLDISQCVSLSCLPEEIGKLKKPSSANSLKSLRHVICDTDVAFMWDEVKKVVPGLKIEAAEKCFSLDWLDE
ncbi:hypothetical protein ARALYDRAFT_913090 [Arabidopsis lyrata subsp. lyrata]|uniref:Zer-1-like leucine-rich repeats region domain-containing protein n=1 Tax=Arabidopsis lyrata subsp. lyrata TaxID=81972 RepID=D7M8S5_ARALL|nr:hypothetical protein ARALYDRAFT_913090 [Arabidopsis lyrata subsp. lyrata]